MLDFIARRLVAIVPVLAVGTLVALLCASSLNALALGDDVATGLGVPVGNLPAPDRTNTASASDGDLLKQYAEMSASDPKAAAAFYAKNIAPRLEKQSGNN